MPLRLLIVLLSLLLAAPALAEEPVQIETLSGESVAADSIGTAGKPMLVVFWATWDSPSKRALNTIHEVHAQWVEATGAPVVIVSMDDVRNKHKVKPYVESKGWTYASYLDPQRVLAKKMGVENPPTAYVLDSERNVVKTFQGFADGDEEKWKAALTAAK